MILKQTEAIKFVLDWQKIGQQPGGKALKWHSPVPFILGALGCNHHQKQVQRKTERSSSHLNISKRKLLPAGINC